jgi:hypothetical protein
MSLRFLLGTICRHISYPLLWLNKLGKPPFHNPCPILGSPTAVGDLRSASKLGAEPVKNSVLAIAQCFGSKEIHICRSEKCSAVDIM